MKYKVDLCLLWYNCFESINLPHMYLCPCYFQVLTKEYYTQQTALEKRIAEMESTLHENQARLQTYEKLEKELDDVVMQAAEGSDIFTNISFTSSYSPIYHLNQVCQYK